jgi:RNA polymerase sigma-70 factor (ECF subfamily)
MADRNQQQEMFAQVFESQSDVIFRFSLIRVSDREQALDITQETFMRLWKSILSGTILQNPRAFLFTVANHLIIDWYRKKKPLRFENEDQDGDNTDAEPADETTLADNLEIGAEGRYLLGKINELPSTYRLAVYLKYVEDLPPPEIGSILGISANAVSVRLNRGIRELKKITGYN